MSTYRPGLVKLLKLCFFLFSFFMLAQVSLAASLQVTPNTGVYSINSTFTVRVTVSSDGKSINAAEGEIKFNPQELSVVSVNRTGSVFNLWVTEPTFSNSAGTLSFSGGSPTGYTGNGGTVFNITFRALRAGTTRTSFTNGSVLANDGKGTNVLSGMNGGTFTIGAAATTPTPEVIEYVAPANTPKAPTINSSTHTGDGWSKEKTAVLSWDLPSDVVAVRTLLDESETSVPTKVYETPIKTITLSDLEEGISYFHIQFKNADGWGRVTHYRLAVDTVKPESVTIELPAGADLSNPEQTLKVTVDEETSPVTRYMVRINGGDAYEYLDETGEGMIKLAPLEPGYQTILLEAFDAAGNSQIGSLSFTILAFDKPVFTDYPREINKDVIPVIRGQSRPSAEVYVTVERLGSSATEYKVMADESGIFTFIPEGKFSEGTYKLTARAVDIYGAQSELSDEIRIAVQQPGYLRIGNQIVSVLSVIVPLVAMLVILALLLFWFFVTMRKFRQTVGVESKEAHAIVSREFASLESKLKAERAVLTGTKRSKKLTLAEEQMFANLEKMLVESKGRITKEVQDVEDLVPNTD